MPRTEWEADAEIKFDLPVTFEERLAAAEARVAFDRDQIRLNPGKPHIVARLRAAEEMLAAMRSGSGELLRVAA